MMKSTLKTVIFFTLIVFNNGQAGDLLVTAQQALQNKHYAQANQLATQAFQQAVDPIEQGKALSLLGQSLSQQENYYAAAQALQGALAQDENQPEAKQLLSQVLKKLPKSLVRSLNSDKVGDRFEGSVSDWDEAKLEWETKDVLQELPKKKTTPSAHQELQSTQKNQPTPIQHLAQPLTEAQYQHQDWVLSGEMREKLADQQDFYRRLFSLEAGFASVQESAQIQEGVNPW